MKKYIAIATLLAAGSVFANAAEVLTTPVDGTLTSSNSFLAWESGVTLQSWQVTFDLDVTRNALDNVDLATICGSWKFAINSDGSVEFYKGNDSYNSQSWGLGVDPVSIAVSFIGDYNVAGDFLNTGTLYAKSGDNEFSVKVVDNLQIASGTGFRLWTNTAKEQYANIAVSKLSNNVIPEPSTFGLLAGLGALALVGTRRRRK